MDMTENIFLIREFLRIYFFPPLESGHFFFSIRFEKA